MAKEGSHLAVGTVRIQVGDEFFDLEEGDTIYFEGGVPHRVVNLGTSPARIISALTPPSF
jgi:mannose-6-phosphate isomerase-like protein (cupin superfamily)